MDSPDFVRIERLLAGRACIVFGGREHTRTACATATIRFARAHAGGDLDHPLNGNLNPVTVRAHGSAVLRGRR